MVQFNVSLQIIFFYKFKITNAAYHIRILSMSFEVNLKVTNLLKDLVAVVELASKELYVLL